MDSFLISFQTVSPLFLLILSGVVFSKAKTDKNSWIEVLNKYALWIGFPALVVSSLMHLDLENEESFLNLIVINSIYILSCLVLAYILSIIFKFPRETMGALFLVLPFGNIAYMGMPVLTNTFGPDVAHIAAIIAAVYVFWMVTAGIILLEISGTNSFEVKKICKSLLNNPLLISVFVGLILLVFQIKLLNSH